ncbi:hypothetical protein [Sphingobium yanoikuyae]|uniref:hypothetical protein n=1 Tax=Sphingobium yanoikuyae TaxID=13690 RepID=UPI0012906857|nr:hypothetical protein [Sphingobium yanoikuyae]
MKRATIDAWSWKPDAYPTPADLPQAPQIAAFAAYLDAEYLQMVGVMAVTRDADQMGDDRPARNKTLVTAAMTALFQRRDAAAVERQYVPDYVRRNTTLPEERGHSRRLSRACRRMSGASAT